MNKLIVVVFLLSSVAGSPAGQHDQAPTVAVAASAASSNETAASESKQLLQTSPKDALTVTKRRFINQDWCQSNPLIQRVGHDHCLSTTILNRFCYGQCNSFFIPKNQLGGGGSGSGSSGGSTTGHHPPRKAFESCATCRPKKTSRKTVTLKCPGLQPPIRRKRVQIIHQCRCMQPQDSSASS